MTIPRWWLLLFGLGLGLPAPRTGAEQPAGTCPSVTAQEQWGRVVDAPTVAGYREVLCTDHFDVWAAPGAEVIEEHVAIGEAHIRLMESLLGRDFDARIRLFVYPDPAAVRAATAKDLLMRRELLAVPDRDPRLVGLSAAVDRDLQR